MVHRSAGLARAIPRDLRAPVSGVVGMAAKWEADALARALKPPGRMRSREDGRRPSLGTR